MSNSNSVSRRGDAGVAFILVIGVLAGLLVLAAPFLAVALNDREVARKVVAEAEVAAYADGVQKYARIALERSHAYRETANGRDPAADIFSTPKWDTAPEFAVPLDMVDGAGKALVGSDGKPLLVRDDPRGLLLDLTVRDEQSLPNLWASSPFLIAAYLGRGTLTADVEPTATELALDVGDGFPLKNGALLIEGERITYTERVGGSFKGLGRAAIPSGRARKLKAETWAIDDRAREIAMLPWKSPRAAGAFREPLSASAAKEIVLGGSGILSPVEADRLARHFNVASHRYMADGFGLARALTGNVDPTTADVTDGFKIRVENNDGINAGSVVRITDGVNVDYGYVLRSERGGGQFATLTLIEATRNGYVEGRTQVAPLVRNRVNINSCSEDLLKTLILGNQLTFGRFGQGSQARVTTAGATFFVEGIVAARPIRGWDELRNVLQSTIESYPLVTDGSQLQAIFRNAVDSGDWLLSNTTVPFSFRSYDYFSNETAASKNDLSGRELARIRIRELSRVSPPVSQIVRIDSQEEFEESILFARQSPYFTTFPNPVESYEQGGETPQSRIGRMLLFSANSGASKQAGVFPHKIEGDVRMWPARLNELGGYAEHFDGQAFQQPSNVDVLRVDADGWLLDGGAFELALRNPGQGQRGGGGGRGGGGRGGRGGQGAGAFLDNRGPNPIKVDFWWKSGQLGGRQVMFDFVGANPDEARIQMVKEQDGSFRARVRDRTIVDPLSGFDETAETVFVPEAGVMKPETWYHLGMSYRGTKPEDVGFWIDGMRRGKAKYSSVLTGAVQKTATSFDAEDLTDWPNYGAAWVGREIVEFRRSGNTLTVIDYPTSAVGGVVGATTTGRGRRGTAAIDHGAGEPVQLLGYSTPVASQGNGGGLAVPRGGGTLKAELGPFNLASFTGNSVENISLTAPPLPPVSFQLRVLDPTKPNGDQLDLVDAPGCLPDYTGFQTSGGYALIVSSFAGLPANILTALANQGFYSGAELVYYSSRSGSVLNGIQSPSLAQWAGPLAQLNANISMSLVRQKHPTNFANGPGANRKLVCVFPISVGLSDVSGYFDPQPAPGATAGGGTASNAPEFVSLGSPDYRDIQTHKVEWIRYYHRDTSRGQLLCDETSRLAAAAQTANVMLAAQGGANAVAGPWLLVNAALNFRSQLGTSIFGYDDLLGAASLKHAANEDVVPVFRVVEHPGIGLLPPPVNSQPNTPNPAVPPGPAAGWGDSVTLEQANGAVRKRFDVSWSADADIGNHGLVSFGTSPGQDFTQGRLQAGANIDRSTVTRILKFPTGEMPAMGRGSRGRLGGDVDGNTAGSKLDELRVAPFDEERFIVWDQTAMGLNTTGTNVAQGTTRTAVDTTTDEIPIANLDWILSDTNYTPGDPFVTLPDHRRVFHDMALRGLPNNDAGLVQIDDELIAFRAIGAGRNGGQALLRCERGFMNTTPQNHGYASNVVYLGFMPVSMLSGGVSPTDREFPLADTADFGREGGLVLIDDELAHYSEIQGRALRMPPNLDPAGQEVGGLLRGRFGTRASAHDTDSIVVDMPFRHWDRYADRQDNAEIGWYGISINEPGAYLESFAYEEFRPNANVKLRAFLRTEPDQRWSDAPGRGLLRFEEGVPADKAYRIDRRVSFVELRFMAQFESGSFDPVNLTQHEWKSSPELRSIEVKFTNRTRVLSRETER